MRFLVLLILTAQLGFAQTTERWLKIEYKNQPADSIRVADVERMTFLDYSTGFSGTVTDIDGNIYHTVIIGDQEWTVENLRVTKYNDGTDIIKITTDNNGWVTTTIGAYCAYNNDESNVATNGYLYNWYSVNTGKLVPEGWRVPTDEDWTNLTDFVGGFLTAGAKLKAMTDWNDNGNGTDDFRFGALPGGARSSGGGTFYGIGVDGYWWSSTHHSMSSSAWYRSMSSYGSNSDSITQSTQALGRGFSVRLVRDVQ